MCLAILASLTPTAASCDTSPALVLSNIHIYSYGSFNPSRC